MCATDADSGWFKVAVDVPSSAEGALLSLLQSHLPAGAEVLGDEARPLHPELVDLPAEWIRFGVYGRQEDIGLLEERLADALASLRSKGRVPEASCMRAPEPIPDGWRDRWKSFFHVTRVTPRVVIRPSWEPYIPVPGDCVLDLDPGAAFGTGGHATTRLCLNAIDPLLPAPTMVDVGTGSGVLSIAAAKLGVASVVAVDNDDTAVDVARENVATNSVWDRVRVSATPLDDVPGTYGIVVANIIASVLDTLAESLVAHVAPGGDLILSGILSEEGNWLSATFSSLGMTEIERTAENGWICLHLRRV